MLKMKLHDTWFFRKKNVNSVLSLNPFKQVLARIINDKAGFAFRQGYPVIYKSLPKCVLLSDTSIFISSSSISFKMEVHKRVEDIILDLHLVEHYKIPLDICFLPTALVSAFVVSSRLKLKNVTLNCICF